MSHKFLSQIADYYTTPERITSLSDITFVFPNKRSALFLKRYIQARIKGRCVMMPRFSTFRRLATRITGMGEIDRFEALFMLYRSYVEAVEEKNPDQIHSMRDFDKFIFWGDMILNDFDTIDSSLADASKLYRNIKAVHELTADYLTPEQKEVIERIWGVNNLSIHVEHFWKHVRPDGTSSEASEKFLTLWDILFRIYEIFNLKLDNAGLATGGRLMRSCLKMLKENANARLFKGTFVFVGHSELTTAELAIMDELHRRGKASFFWDIEGPIFSNDAFGADVGNRAVRLIKRLKERYPMPLDFSSEQVASMPQIEIIGVPSSVGQAKGAAQTVASWLNSGTITHENAVNTAVVVPDTSQLMPFMLGLPENLPGLNVSMGLPYSTTTFATLFSSIIAMQRNVRTRRGGNRTFFYQNVLEVLMHPHIRLLTGDRGDRLRQHIIENRLFHVDSDMLIGMFPALSFVFSPLDSAETLDHAYLYVSNLLEGLFRGLSANDAPDSSKAFELDILKAFRAEVARLKDLIARYGVVMRESTFLSLFESILKSKILNVEGTPLEGVQVLGVLETRSIDFDNLIFMAMNERSFPRRDYVKTMIPNNLRQGYGLPPIEWSEHFYAYNFFRALSRASNVVLFYDTRPPGRGTGEISRYLTRLQFLFPKAVTTREIDLVGLEHQPRTIEVKKTPDVMARLQRYLTPGGPNLSASVLKNYKHCPLMFYLRNVNNLGEEEPPLEYLDSAKQGDIFHRSAKRIFDKYSRMLISSEVLREMACDADLALFVAQEVARFAGSERENPTDNDLTFEGVLIKAQISAQLRSMLLAEAEACTPKDGFRYVAGEYDVKGRQWEIAPGIAVNFRMQIDRIDSLDSETLRFIDYKTGGDETSVDNIKSLFGGNHKKDAIFQLLVYAEAYHDLIDPSKKIIPSIYNLRKIVQSGEISPIAFNRKPMEPFPALSSEFRPLLNDMIAEIFNPEIPFRQSENIDSCKFCPFVKVCGRNVQDDK